MPKVGRSILYYVVLRRSTLYAWARSSVGTKTRLPISAPEESATRTA